MLNSYAEATLNKVKYWLNDVDELSYRVDNPISGNSHFKLWIFFKDEKIISISLNFPRDSNSKNDNYLIVGWKWRLNYSDIADLYGLKDLELKNSLASISDEYTDKGFDFVIETEKFSKMMILNAKIPLSTLSQKYLLNRILDLSLAWIFILRHFKRSNITRS